MNLAPQPPQPPPPTHPLGVVVNGSTAAAASVALDLLDDFEPQPRDRCNTWPLQRPTGGDLGHNTSPLIHEDIPEECDDEECLGSDGNLSSTGSTSCYPSNASSTAAALAVGGGGYYTPLGGITGDHVPVCPGDFGGGQSSYQNAASGLALSAQQSAAGNKKNTSRRNAWGNLSYADLITQAIQSSPEQRLTLNEIYTWFFTNLPFFREKGDSNSSAGWKNSIRHNLSLHNRFLRLQNEGAGKSSWWTLNPDAKPGKSSRRRTGSMEQQQAVKLLEKKRGRSKKKLDPTHASTGTLQEMYPGGASSSTSINSLGSPSIDSTSMGGASVEFKSEFMEGGVPPNAVLTTYMPGAGRGGPMDFRGRSDSSVSDYLPGSKSGGGGHLSPTAEAGAGGGLFDDWDYNGPTNGGGHARSSTNGCSDLDVERDNLRYPDLIHTLSQSMTLGGAAGDPMTGAAAANGPPSAAASSSVRHRLLQSTGARMGPPPPPYRPLMNGFAAAAAANAADGGADAADVVRPSPAANPDDASCAQARGHATSLATAPAPVKQQPVISSNGFCGGGGASCAPLDVKTEPPAYQELYGRPPPAHTVAAGNPMLRDVLQHKILANHQKQQQQQRSLTSTSPSSVFLMTSAPAACDLAASFSPSGRLLMSSPSAGLMTSSPSTDSTAAGGTPINSACCVRPSAAATALLYQQHRPGAGGPLAGCSLYGQAAYGGADPSSAAHVGYVMPPMAPQYHHGGHPYYPTPLQLQLPMELSEIHYDHTFKADIQCDIEQVIRHEMHVAGNLDFTDI